MDDEGWWKRLGLSEFHVEKSSRARGGTGSHLFHPKANRLRLYACKRRERAAFTMQSRSRARSFLPSFSPFFLPFSSPSLARALIQKISAARQVAPVDARSRLPDSTNLAAIHLSTSLRPTYLSASSFVHEVNYELFLLGTRYRELKFELRLEGNGGERGESLDKNGINKEGNTADGVD